MSAALRPPRCRHDHVLYVREALGLPEHALSTPTLRRARASMHSPVSIHPDAESALLSAREELEEIGFLSYWRVVGSSPANTSPVVPSMRPGRPPG